MIKTDIEKLFINHIEIVSKEAVKIYNPASLNEIVGEMSLGTEEDVDLAVEAAEAAWNSWSITAPKERGELLKKIADSIEEYNASLAEILVRENGRVLSEVKGDILGGANVLRYYSSLTEEVKKEEIIENHQGKMVLARQPMGVVSIIVPWNSPVYLTCLMLGPALMAGNTVVIKPSTYSPIALTRILTAAAKILPKGVLNIVLGSGSTVGEAMVRHPKVRKISFTGSTEVGAGIIRSSAATIKNVSMELGGNDAAIILRDAEINERLIDELIKGVFIGSGQICYGVKRIYVQREKYTDFVDRFIEAASRIKVGNGLDERSTIGPVNNKAQYSMVKQLISQAEASGATVTAAGELVEGTIASEGYFILPTIITGVEQKHPIVQDEQFGPIIPIMPFETEEEAIEMANDTEFGLGNSIWTRDVNRGFQLGRKLQSGSVFVNIHRVGASAVNMPFGGFKQSGIGRGHGVEALYEQMELQAIIHRSDM
ncbi:aldehyde dehydrogenase [Bacillus sp. M6-12]|uniref:aldehyde dehydrogenase family protein n=1 Tax=Bacillus sp. M6-12 TaxID=2054166 RepID=UPI000C76BF52|nr:aldehyde dehydrogenase family protein [Bacillus sp. M6-12]PLS17050.1 aldehyde dehydrogenase [Bacillus sp. M6-12]